LSPYRSSRSKSGETEEDHTIARVSRTHKDVQDLKAHKVAGVGESSETALDQYKDIFEGVDLEFMKDDAFQKDHNGFSVSLDDEESKTQKNEAIEDKAMSGTPLTEEDQEEVQRLQARDREVRTHEQAHVAAGGQYVRGGISYEYQQGPDGRRYAVGGHVSIDVSEAGTPEETIQKMRQVRRAALAPAEPSGADRSVASEASKKEQNAQAELNKERVDDRDQAESKDQKKVQGNKETQDHKRTQDHERTQDQKSRSNQDSDSSIDQSSFSKSRRNLTERSASSYTDHISKKKMIKPPRA
jgi:hypothetical protein